MKNDEKVFPEINSCKIGSEESTIVNGGLSLRDYFASKAPKMEEQCYNDSPSSEHITETIASWNYLYADAMLKERNK